MATYGNTIDQTIGLTVAGTEILTGQAGKVSRGLRSIGAEIVKLANETGTFSYEIQGATKTISLFDEAGKMLNTYDVLKEIYGDWNKLTEAEQSSLALTLGMKTQIDVLSAIFSNFETAIDATAIAEESHGSAMRENARYMESLASMVTLFKAEFQELVLGDGGLSDFLKIVIQAGTAVLKFANSDLGQFIIKTTLVVATVKGLNTAFIALSNSYVANLVGITALEVAQNGLKAGMVLLHTELKALSASLLTSPFGQLALIAGGAILLAKGIDAVTVSMEEQIESFKDAKKEYDNANDSLEQTESKLESVNQKIEELNSLEKLSITDQEELDKLQEEKEELEYILAIETERARLAQEKAEEEARKTLSKSFSDADAFGTTTTGGVQDYTYAGSGNLSDAVSGLNVKLEDLNTRIEETKQKQKELAESQKGDTQEYKNTEIILEELERQYNELSEKQLGYVDTLHSTAEVLGEDSEEYEKAVPLLEKFSEITGNHAFILGEEKEAVEDNVVATDKLEESLNGLSSKSMADMNGATKDTQDVLAQLKTEIEGVTATYQVAVNALDEYNRQGYLSVDTYSQLMNVAPEYLAMMIDENGQFYANADGATALYQAKVYEMGVTAARAQIQLANHLYNEGKSYADLGQQAINASGGIWELVNAEIAEGMMTKDKASYEALRNKINAINELTQNTIANAKATTASVVPTNNSTRANNRNTGARNKNANATKKQTEALKKQKKALEDEANALESQIKDYEIVIDYVKDLLKEEQEAVEEQKDAELKAIKDKMDALEAEKDAFNEDLDLRIDALDKQRESTEKYWDDQIDAIKNANKALDDNIKLQQLQEALARANTQTVKVLKGGKFVYAKDEEAISKAEQELADYEMQLSVQKQIQELEKLKEQALGSLDKQVEELENHRNEINKTYDDQLKDLQAHYDSLEEEYDARLKQYDLYLKQFEDMLEASSKRHAEILYNELVGEQGNWDARISALSKFVSNYENKKSQLDGIKNQINSITEQISGMESSARSLQANVNGIASNVGAKLASINSMAQQAESAYTNVNENYNAVLRTQFRPWVDYGLGKVPIGGWHNSYDSANEVLAEYTRQHVAEILRHNASTGVEKVNKWAVGTYSMDEDQIALVGDSPSNREFVIGSKVNKSDGILGKFSKGTGVVPHGRNFTETLIDMARWFESDGDTITNNTNKNNNINNVRIENINLPQVKDGEGFVEYLKNNFFNSSVQFANVRV